MKVILLQDIKALGKKGELAEVSEGYGRNYLLPKKLAKEANAQAMNEYKNAENSKNYKIATAKAQAEQDKQKLEGKVFRMKANGNNGKLFGSVRQQRQALRQHHLKADRRGDQEAVRHRRRQAQGRARARHQGIRHLQGGGQALHRHLRVD